MEEKDRNQETEQKCNNKYCSNINLTLLRPARQTSDKICSRKK